MELDHIIFGDIFPVVNSSIFRSWCIILAATVIAALIPFKSFADSVSNGTEVVIQGRVSKALRKVSSSLTKKGITKLPSVSSSAGENQSSSSSDATIMAVSGTPPTLASFSTSSIKNVFWRDGVVDAIANDTAVAPMCQEFFSSETDGLSGGLGSCHMAEGVGRSFETMLNSEASICYMKNMPTKANLKAGGIELLKGEFPEEDITKLFAPGKKNRLVKIHTEPLKDGGPSEKIFIKILSTSSNKRKDNFYKAELYFCPEGADVARGYNLIEVTEGGIFRITVANLTDPFGGGAHQMILSGYLDYSSSKIKWDTTRSRTATVDFIKDNSSQFKANFEVTGDNLIYLKTRGINGDNFHNDYSISHFSGSDIFSVSFLEGGFRGTSQIGQNEARSFDGATEYRDSYYASSPSNSLLTQVQTHDMNSDDFYSSPPAVNFDPTPYSCAAKPDIEIRFDGQNETLRKSLEPCFTKRLTNMDFCNRDPDVQLALQNFPNSCRPQPSVTPTVRDEL